jgi:general secretion pathway protein L
VTLPADALGEALRIAQSGADSTATGARGLVLYTGAVEWERHAAQIEAARPQFDGIHVQLLSAGPLALFAQQLPSSPAINLLQGAYAPSAGRGFDWRAWRVAAILLACLLGLHVDTMRSTLPGEANSAEPRRSMERRLSITRGAGGGLLPALQALAQARDATPGVSVQALNFHDGTLDLTLSAADAESLDHLGQTLRTNGWDADLIGGSNSGARYEGRIQVRARGT